MTSRIRRPLSAWGGVRAALLVGPFVCSPLLLCACSSVDHRIDLAPFVRSTEHPDSGVTETDVLGPLVPHEENEAKGTAEYGLRPFFYVTERPWTERGLDQREKIVSILAPFAKYHTNPRTTQFRFWPLFWWTDENTVNGGEDFDWMLFPILYYGSSEPAPADKAAGDQEDAYFAIFPLGGQINDFVGYDRFQFLAWPILQRVSKRVYDDEETFNSILLLIGWTKGAPRGGSWHVLPFYMKSQWVYPPHRAPKYPPGTDPSQPLPKYDKRAYAWPFVHVQDLMLDRGPGQEAHLFSIWPLFKHQAAFDHDFWTILWPFFRYNREYPDVRRLARLAARTAQEHGELPPRPETFEELQARGFDTGKENLHVDFLSQVVYRYQRQDETVDAPFEDTESGFWRQRLLLILYAEYHTLPLDKKSRVDAWSVLQPIGFFRRDITELNAAGGYKDRDYYVLVPFFTTQSRDWLDKSGAETGRHDRFTKLWPLISYEWNGDGSRNIHAFSLLPLRLDKYVKDFNDSWSFLWNLYEYRRAPDAAGGYTRHAALFRLIKAYSSKTDTSVSVPLLYSYRWLLDPDGAGERFSVRFLGGLFGWEGADRDGKSDRNLVLFWLPIGLN